MSGVGLERSVGRRVGLAVRMVVTFLLITPINLVFAGLVVFLVGYPLVIVIESTGVVGWLEAAATALGSVVPPLPVAVAVPAWLHPAAIVGFWLPLVAVAVLAFVVPVRAGPALLRHGVDATVVGAGEEPRFERTLERVARGAGIPTPRPAIVESPVPRSFAAGRKGGGTVVVTRGLLDLLDDDQLAAVLAHEVSHLLNRDAAVICYAAWYPLLFAVPGDEGDDDATDATADEEADDWTTADEEADDWTTDPWTTDDATDDGATDDWTTDDWTTDDGGTDDERADSGGTDDWITAGEGIDDEGADDEGTDDGKTNDGDATVDEEGMGDLMPLSSYAERDGVVGVAGTALNWVLQAVAYAVVLYLFGYLAVLALSALVAFVVALVISLPLLVVAQHLGWLLAVSLSRSREYAADRGAVAITGDPAALATALETLYTAPPPDADLRTVDAVEPLAVLPFDDRTPRGLVGRLRFRTHPPTEERIERLRATARRQEHR